MNAPADVEKVQTLLKSKKIYQGRVDKNCGPKTITAIKKFQAHFMRMPDGRVDANGSTWKKLTGVLPMGRLCLRNRPRLLTLISASRFHLYLLTGTWLLVRSDQTDQMEEGMLGVIFTRRWSGHQFTLSQTEF